MIRARPLSGNDFDGLLSPPGRHCASVCKVPYYHLHAAKVYYEV
jgi:hypothetical protein